jgi:SAM-dependent methyltransferase
VTLPRLYADRAELYDLAYSWKDFAAEAEKLHALLAARGVPDGARLLDAACGTGAHLAQLARWYDVAGFDLSDDMLAVARRRLPGVPLTRADLETFTVDHPFDVVTCLFSSIGYLIGEDALRRAACRLATATRPGGLLVVEPWLEPSAWNAGRTTAQCGNAADASLARVTHAGRDGDVATCERHYLVARRGLPMESFVEMHRMWLCPHATLLAVFRDAGLDAELHADCLMEGRGLLVGRR